MLNIDSYLLALFFKWGNKIFAAGNKTASKKIENLFCKL